MERGLGEAGGGGAEEKAKREERLKRDRRRRARKPRRLEGPKGGHSGEEPEGGVTQKKTAGWCWRWAGPRDGAQTNPWGAVPKGCGRDQVGRSPRSFHFKGPRCVV